MSNSRDHSGKKPADAATLRQRAEEQARTMEPISLSAQAPEAIERMLHELRVHQIELEMQNEELRRAQAEIEDGRARYFDLYDLAPVGYCTLSEKGLILEANLTAATLLGEVRSALIKQPLSRFILKDDRDIYYLHRKHLFETGEPQQCELRLVKPDGAPFWAQLTGTAAQGQDGELVCRVVVSDIAGRKRVEDELQRNLTMLARTEHLANIGSWEWDIDADCTRWSEELFRIFQRDPALGAPSLAEHPGIYVAEDMERLWAAVQKCISNGTPYELELRAIRTDGMIRHCVARGKAECDEKGRIIRLVGSLQDITERKEAEKKLRKSESLFRTLVNTIPDLIWLKDAAGVYLVCNKRFERFFGASETEICGKTDYDFVDEEMADLFREHDRKALAVGGISRNEEQITDADDGHTIFLETIKTPMFDSDGNLVGVLGIGRDITERKAGGESFAGKRAQAQ
jgi:PAS domain S-box-containing protein